MWASAQRDGRPAEYTLLASNIGTILDKYFAQYWLHIVRNIYPILDSSHFNNIGPILTVNIGPILVTLLAQHCKLPASNIETILDKCVIQYWLHIVRNICPILDSSHFNNIGPILTVNVGPILVTLLAQHCKLPASNIGTILDKYVIQ